jgi:site-specific DNA-methyltransferase (adenine-specific)
MKDMCSRFSGLILDPFAGSGTTLRSAKDLGMKAVGIEINEKYCEIIAERMTQQVMDIRT